VTAPPSPTRERLCDGDLESAVALLLTHDQRVRDLDISATVRGGVVHLTGDVGTAADLATVRALVGRLAGVHAVWDRVRIAGRPPLVLDVGCGDTCQYPDNIGVDLRHGDAVAVQADVAHRLPFRDACADRVFVVHLLEHLPDFLPLIDECHRVLRPGGVLHVLAPWWRHVNAVADPTHLRLIDTQTFKMVCSRRGSARYWYPLHVSCDGATVFADLTPSDSAPDEVTSARWFD
jgi:SAM-dependent methyltransferase